MDGVREINAKRGPPQSESREVSARTQQEARTHLLARRESSCNELGALSTQFVVSNVQTSHYPTSDSGIRDSKRGK